QAKQSAEQAAPSDTQGHWASQTIDIFVKLGVVSGYDDGSFRPNDNITRAEFAAIVARIFKFTAADNSVALQDISNHWAKDAIEALAMAGIIGGYGDGSFRPDQQINREEMVIILSRLVNLQALSKDATRGHFSDM